MEANTAQWIALGVAFVAVILNAWSSYVTLRWGDCGLRIVSGSPPNLGSEHKSAGSRGAAIPEIAATNLTKNLRGRSNRDSRAGFQPQRERVVTEIVFDDDGSLLRVAVTKERNLINCDGQIAHVDDLNATSHEVYAAGSNPDASDSQPNCVFSEAPCSVEYAQRRAQTSDPKGDVFHQVGGLHSAKNSATGA